MIKLHVEEDKAGGLTGVADTFAAMLEASIGRSRAEEIETSPMHFTFLMLAGKIKQTEQEAVHDVDGIMLRRKVGYVRDVPVWLNDVLDAEQPTRLLGGSELVEITTAPLP